MLSIYWVTLAYVTGIIWGLYLELNVLIITSIFLCFILLTTNNKLKKFFIVMIMFCILGSYHTIGKIEKYDNKYFDEQSMDLYVVILSQCEEEEYIFKYNCKSANGDKFILQFKKNNTKHFKVGESLKINGKFVLPDTARNEGGFNYRRYLNSNGYYGTIKVDNYEIAKDNFSLLNLVYGVQNYINNTFEKYLSKNFSGILSGMIVGEISNISDEVKIDFQNSGITHLLAVSGSNVATVILFSNYLVIKLFGKKYSDYICLVFIIFFILISGASPSVVRAGIMAILNLFANVFSKRSDSIDNLTSASLFMLIYNPLTLINTGFLLSFAGTIGIIFFSKNIKEYILKHLNSNMVAEILSLNISAQIMIFPIILYFFNLFSLTGILANLLIIPVTNLLTFLGIILLFSSIISFSISKIISLIINLIINYILSITEFLSEWEFFSFTLSTPTIWMIASYYIVLFLVWKHLQLRKQNYLLKISNMKNELVRVKICRFSYVIISILIMISIITKFIPKNYTEVTAIDVGQGDSFLIVSEKGKRILIDGGGSETSDYDVGKNILMPYLLDRRFKQIDYIFVSHAHADHIDGVYTILENFDVGKVFISAQKEYDEKILKLKEIALKKKVEVVEIFEGDKIKIDDLEFEILYPDKNSVENNINNLSIVMILKCNERKILFTGDAEKNVEEYLLKKYLKKLNVDILKVGHHGANTSSSEEFINIVSPAISIISVAEENLYGHPNVNVVNCLKNFGQVLKTSEIGEITIKIFNNGNVNIFPFL